MATMSPGAVGREVGHGDPHGIAVAIAIAAAVGADLGERGQDRLASPGSLASCPRPPRARRCPAPDRPGAPAGRRWKSSTIRAWSWVTVRESPPSSNRLSRTPTAEAGQPSRSATICVSACSVGVPGRSVPARSRAVPRRPPASRPVRLAVARQRQLLKQQHVGRHHVARQPLSHVVAQRRSRRGALIGRPSGRLPRRSRPGGCALIGPQQHSRCGHAGMRKQRRLHLARLDPVAAQLHLVVDPAEVTELPPSCRAGPHPDQVTGAVPTPGTRGSSGGAPARTGPRSAPAGRDSPGPARPRPRAGRRGRRPAAGSARRGQRRGGLAGDRAADRADRCVRVRRDERPDHRVHRGLGGPVEVHQRRAVRPRARRTTARAGPRRTPRRPAARCAARRRPGLQDHRRQLTEGARRLCRARSTCSAARYAHSSSGCARALPPV